MQNTLLFSSINTQHFFLKVQIFLSENKCHKKVEILCVVYCFELNELVAF